ncbi:hypothetical protein DFR41_110114 [Pseudacidovorax intermedius]|uniref:Uncharacterized protein n=1 Tax=Pseudacidovorax intermedius TaxID=433924 RepID=A0A370F857_9BURK|nr:hypothetical protein [Pseudacidovorax intermedius]RDI20706.1 hypothetical protein DFR41_110114 [Pseudacidovorax intermedius]
MENELIDGAEPLPDDKAIVAALEPKAKHMIDLGWPAMVAGVRNHRGVVYRRITVHGFGQLVTVGNVLGQFGLVNELKDMGEMRDGYRAIYSRPA